MKTILCGRSLILFLCLLLSIGAHASPSKFVYELDDDQRVEVHYDKNGEYGSVRILLYRKNQNIPLVLALEDPKNESGKSLIDGQSRKFVFPTPNRDFDSKSLPDWIVVEPIGETFRALEHGGILLIRDYSESGHFVQAFPLSPRAVKEENVAPRPYIIEDAPRTQRFPYRLYSAVFVESAGHPNAPETNLLMSIVDMDPDGENFRFGTVILRQDGRFQHQNRVFSNFALKGKRYEFQPSDKPGFMNILADGKVWGNPVAYENVKWQTRWPGTLDISQDPSVSPEVVEKIAANRRQERMRAFEIAQFTNQPLPTQQAYDQFIGKIEDGVPQFKKDEVERIEQEYAQHEPTLKEKMELAENLLKQSGIANELTESRETILRYQVKEFPSNSANIRITSLSVGIGNKRGANKTMNWLFAVDSRTQQIVGQLKIPKTHDLRDLTVMPSGHVYLKNGKIIYLTPQAQANKCADVFRN